MKKGGQKTLRVLVTEDHASTRMGIEQILQDTFNGVVFGEAGNGCETLALLEQSEWDLLILDISLPGSLGMEVLREVKRLRPELPVLIYSAHPEEQFAIHALRAHAAGYLTKERAPEELIGAVRKILAGGRYVPPSLARELAIELKSGQFALPHRALSRRELQVLRLIIQGQTGKAIAHALGLSQKTVSTYRTRIVKKLQLGSAAELIHYAMLHGLA